jgi:hypothetical protein
MVLGRKRIVRICQENVSRADDAGERRTQFMAHIGEKIRLDACGGLRGFQRDLQLRFDLLAGGHVLGHHDETSHRAIGCVPRANFPGQPLNASIGLHEWFGLATADLALQAVAKNLIPRPGYRG